MEFRIRNSGVQNNGWKPEWIERKREGEKEKGTSKFRFMFVFGMFLSTHDTSDWHTKLRIASKSSDERDTTVWIWRELLLESILLPYRFPT